MPWPLSVEFVIRAVQSTVCRFTKLFYQFKISYTFQFSVSLRCSGENHISITCFSFLKIETPRSFADCSPSFYSQTSSYAVAALTTAWRPVLTHLSASRWNVTLTCDIGNSPGPTWTTHLNCPAHKPYPPTVTFANSWSLSIILLRRRRRTHDLEHFHLNISGHSTWSETILVTGRGGL
jgi:hypothetical protein